MRDGTSRRTALLVVLTLLTAPARAAELGTILDTVRWGEGSAEIARAFGARILHLAHPIEFGDSVVDLALRGQTVGGYPFAVYFQMDKSGHGLKRVMLERQRHGANPVVYRAVVAALMRDYGPPADECRAPPARGNGYQATGERVWHQGDATIRAVFAGTTLEAEEGCPPGGAACGLTGHLFVQILPRAAGTPCR